MSTLSHRLRRLGADRSFAAIAILTLALGVGANTAIFSLLQAVLLTPLPYEQIDRVVMLWGNQARGETTWLSPREILSYQEQASTFEHVSAYSDADGNLTGGDEPERVRLAYITPNLFDTLGVRPALGRRFDASDVKPAAADVVILNHGVWTRRFGSATDIIGQTIRLNGVPRTVVGVMPAQFRLPLDYRSAKPTEIFIPLAFDPAELGGWGNRGNIGLGRLKPGVDRARATAELETIGRRWIAAGYLRDQGDGRLFRHAIPVQPFVTGNVRTPLIVLSATVGFVLLIAIANVANLLLARASVRGRDIAIRAALGASRRRIAGEMLSESLLLGVLGGLAGLVLASVGIRALVAMRPAGLPRVENVQLDTTVLMFCALTAVAAGVLFGLLPALHLSRPRLAAVLQEGGRSGTDGRGRRTLRGALVVAQVALSVVLVLGAGLLARSLAALGAIDLGFDPSNVLTAQIQLPSRDYAAPADVVRFYQRLTERLEQIPGVSRAAVIRILPLSRTIGDWSITIEGKPRQPNENPNGDYQAVTPGYLKTMRLGLVRGRFIGAEDHPDAPLVTVVNETMAARYWPGEDPIGKRFRMGTGEQPWMTIVGVVRGVRHNAIVEEERAEMYVAHAQLPREIGGTPRVMALVMRTGGDPRAMAGTLRAAVRELDPNLPLSDVLPMETVVADALSEQRFTAFLLSVFATLALLLAGIGIYGTISLIVSERAQEIGIRMALGAERRGIARMILSRALVLAVSGIIIGVCAAAVLSRTLETLVYGVSTHDPLTFASVPAVLAAVALAAALAPALRAAALDPIETLRR
jgi:putative ABC transport system permease protein